MKRLFASIFCFLALASTAKAAGTIPWDDITYTSYTEASSASPVLFTSAAVQFAAITISSPAPNSFIAFYRSTSAAFTQDITTQTYFGTGNLQADGPVTIPMYDICNTSYTYWYKSGNAKIMLWLRYPIMSKGRAGLPQGLSGSGNNTGKLLFQ